MKRLLLTITFILATAYTLCAQEEVIGVAILKTVDEVGDVRAGVKLNLRATLAYAVNHMSGYEAYTRVNLSEIMDEHKFQRSGFVSDDQIKEIGKATGAKYILIAEAAYFDESHITVTASIIDIETTRLKAAADPEISPIDAEGMKESCIKIARSLLGLDGMTIGRTESPRHPNGREGPIGEKEFHRIMNEKIKQNGTLIYAQSPSDNQYCDGKYEDDGDREEYFEVNLNGLTREHFCIVFRFQADDYKGTWWAGTEQYPLVLSSGWRILGILLKEDGHIYLTTNNQRHEYSTGLTYTPRKEKTIELEYDNGVININGIRLNVELNEYNGDNVLSSTNYSSGNAFKGYISSVRVYNMK